MTDLEITRLCAEEMEYIKNGCWQRDTPLYAGYDPLHNDAQAMAMVKKFQLSVGFNNGWWCVKNDDRGKLLSGSYHYPDLNRAICEAVARMQASK